MSLTRITPRASLTTGDQPARTRPDRDAGAGGQPEGARLEELAQRNAFNERALGELRAAHDVLRRRYEAAMETLRTQGATPEHPHPGRP